MGLPIVKTKTSLALSSKTHDSATDGKLASPHELNHKRTEKIVHLKCGKRFHHQATIRVHRHVIGGLGTIMILSYSESTIGPYDELLYIPGKWKYKDGSSGFRITCLVASSMVSVENGRRNWNIPKSFANFSITTSGKVTTIKVTLPGATEPFFHVQTKPVTLLSRISMPLTLLLGKSTPFVQPRLPAGERPEEIATDAEWASFAFSTKGSAHLERIVPQMDGGKVGDGKNFPAIVPWSFGVYAPHAEFDVAESVFASDTLS